MVDVVSQVRAEIAAACLRTAAASLPAAGFRIVAAIKTAAYAANASTGLHARLTGGETLIPLRLRALIAEVSAWVASSAEGGSDPYRTEQSARHRGA